MKKEKKKTHLTVTCGFVSLSLKLMVSKGLYLDSFVCVCAACCFYLATVKLDFMLTSSRGVVLTV